jgi:hypothetical protein
MDCTMPSQSRTRSLHSGLGWLIATSCDWPPLPQFRRSAVPWTRRTDIKPIITVLAPPADSSRSLFVLKARLWIGCVVASTKFCMRNRPRQTLLTGLC